MTLSEIYRARAAALAERAKLVSTPAHKERFKRMALGYERLARGESAFMKRKPQRERRRLG